jgi:hypothetical protein
VRVALTYQGWSAQMGSCSEILKLRWLVSESLQMVLARHGQISQLKRHACGGDYHVRADDNGGGRPVRFS